MPWVLTSPFSHNFLPPDHTHRLPRAIVREPMSTAEESGAPQSTEASSSSSSAMPSSSHAVGLPSVALNLIVLRSRDIQRAATFYALVGLSFVEHQHGKNGPVHLAAELGSGSVVFELYPEPTSRPADATLTTTTASAAVSSSGTRVGFRVGNVDDVVQRIMQTFGTAHVVTGPSTSPWGRRAVLVDLDGHKVEVTELSSV